MYKPALAAAAPLFLAAAALAQTAPSPSSKPAQTAPPSAPAAKPGPTPPAHPITTAQARELMQLTGTDKVKTRLIDQITAYMQRAFPPFVPADVKEDVHASLDKMDVDTQSIAIYQRYLSTEDATKVIEFYRTPAGKSYTEATPAILSEIQQNALKQGQTTFQAVMERHKPEIEAAEKKYQADHPAPSLGPAPSGSAPRPGAPAGGGATSKPPQ